jgi:hypothetical protein
VACGVVKAMPASAKAHGSRSGLADQSTIMHRRAIGRPHHGARIEPIARGLRVVEPFGVLL